MADKGKFYITTAIAYTSRKPNIGEHDFVAVADVGFS